MLELTKTILEFVFCVGVIVAAILLLVETVLVQLRRVIKQIRDAWRHQD